MQTWAVQDAELSCMGCRPGCGGCRPQLAVWGCAPWVLAPPALALHRAVESQMAAEVNIWLKLHPQHNLTLQTPHSAVSISRSPRNHPVLSSEGAEFWKTGFSCRKRLLSHFSPPAPQHKAVVRHQQKLDSDCAEHSTGPLLP